MTGRVLVLHGALGLALALPAAAMALAGGVLVYGYELDMSLNPGLVSVAPGAARRPLDELVAAARALEGEPAPSFVRLSRDPRAAVEVWLGPDGERRVFVDPYTGRALGARAGGEGPWGALQRLHMRWALGDAGRVPVALLGTALAAQCFLGLAALVLLKGRGAPGSLWHRRLGAALGPFLLLQAAFGALLAVPEPRRTLMRLGGVAPDRPVSVPARPGAPRASLDAAVAAASAALDGGRLSSVELPEAEGGALKVCFNFGRADYPEGRECAHVDPYEASVLKTAFGLRPEAPLARRANDILYGLHSGRWGGTAGRVSHVLVALVPLALAATGLAARRRRSARSA